MSEIYSIFPDPDALLALEPEEVGGILLQRLNSSTEEEQKHLNFFIFSSRHSVKKYPKKYQDKIMYALMEGAIWLENEGLIAPHPESQRDFVFITRRGRKLLTASDVKAYRKSNLLPKQFLHPIIAEKVWSLYLRGDYDTAVFQSFKEVEIAVREAGEFDDTEIGINLMRKAFHKEKGPLIDKNVSDAEKQSMIELFTGAIGLYKNPNSHRAVSLNDPIKAAEMIIFASHLLGIVDGRKAEI